MCQHNSMAKTFLSFHPLLQPFAALQHEIYPHTPATGATINPPGDSGERARCDRAEPLQT
jgi:hypothetical protein